MPLSTERKEKYHNDLRKYFDEYNRILICGIDNVGSKQLQEIRKALRGDALILMGKNV